MCGPGLCQAFVGLGSPKLKPDPELGLRLGLGFICNNFSKFRNLILHIHKCLSLPYLHYHPLPTTSDPMRETSLHPYKKQGAQELGSAMYKINEAFATSNVWGIDIFLVSSYQPFNSCFTK